MSGSLAVEQLVVKSGSWAGMLFENPALGLDPALVWDFHIEFAELRVPSVGSASPRLTVEWVPLKATAWDRISPEHVVGEEFGEPVESSLYFFQHFRYDAVRLDLISQSGLELTLRTDLRGDIDGLGPDEIIVEATLTFAGIHVPSTSPGDLAGAERALRCFTDLPGLSVKWDGTRAVFTPDDRGWSGFPVISAGRQITGEDVAAALDEE